MVHSVRRPKRVFIRTGGEATLTIDRVHNWRSHLSGWLHSVRHTPYSEGRHDCALFAAGAVTAMTGVDFAAPFRGRYTTTRGGLRVLRRAGFADHIALAGHHLPEVAMAALREGDLVAVPSEMGPALGVVQGALAYVPGLHGTALVSISDAQRAFKVG